MSVHAAPAAVFELQRTDSLKQFPEIGSDGAVYDDAATDSDVENEKPQEEANLEEDDALEDDDIDDSVREDMRKLEGSFPGISGRFRLVNRIGEGKISLFLFRGLHMTHHSYLIGTFSTVYKAEDMLYDRYVNDWDMFQDDHNDTWESPPSKRRRMGSDSRRASPTKRQKPKFVALKKIYVTSSPFRIQNELELLHDLRGCRSVCPLITAFRHMDQVVAVLPFFPHTDFRFIYRSFIVADMRNYFRSLFTALHSVHKHSILHRDIKPT